MKNITRDQANLLPLLSQIYPPGINPILEQAIVERINRARRGNAGQSLSNLSSRSVLLITYADTFTRIGQAPLQTLKQVVDQYLKPFIDSIHILPFYPWSSDDGFAVTDLLAVNPEVGDWTDIENLGQDYQLMFDGVINHLSAKSTWFKVFLAGNPDFDNYFITVEQKDLELLSKVVRPRTLPLVHPFHKEDTELLIWTTFSEDQVDLNYGNPQVLLSILDVLLEYAHKGAKYIRLDAIAYLWKALDSPSIHLPQTHALIQLMRSVLHLAGKPVRLVTETNVPHADNISYFGDGNNEAHLVYNFALPPLLLHSLYSGDTEALHKWASELKTPHPDAHFFNFTASHDGIGITPLSGLVPEPDIEAICQRIKTLGGFVSMKSLPDGSEMPYELNINWLDAMGIPDEPGENHTSEQIDRFLLTQGIMLCLKGLPGIYVHSLFGSQGWIGGVQETGSSRSINREKLDADIVDTELNDPQSRRSIIFSRYTSLLKVRARESAFDPGAEQRILTSPAGCFIIERKSVGGVRLICIFNFRPLKLHYDLSQLSKNNVIYKDLLSGNMLKSEILHIEPYAMAWLQARI